jgi:hypothetical protein
MISVKTNRNIEDFKSDVAGGFDLKETVCIGGCVFVYAGIMLVLMLATPVPKVLCPYIPIPFVAYPIMRVFFKKNGMNIRDYKEKTKKFKEGRILTYKSTENPANYNNFVKKAEELSDEDLFDKTLKNIKKIGIIAGVVIFVIIVAIIVLKFVL